MTDSLEKMAAAQHWLIDIDGVVLEGARLIPGTSEALRRIFDGGKKVTFVSNNSARCDAVVHSKLADAGVEVGKVGILTSAHAAARLIRPGERVLFLGTSGLQEALTHRRAIASYSGSTIKQLGTDEPGFDAVVVGFDPKFDYSALKVAMRAVLAGARFIACNLDSSFPDEDGSSPGCGALVAALVAATGVEPVVAGKPFAPMTDLVVETIFPSQCLVVGDRVETDGLFAKRLKCPFVLVDSQTTPMALDESVEVDLRTPDLLGAVESVLGATN